MPLVQVSLSTLNMGIIGPKGTKIGSQVGVIQKKMSKKPPLRDNNVKKLRNTEPHIQ